MAERGKTAFPRSRQAHTLRACAGRAADLTISLHLSSSPRQGSEPGEAFSEITLFKSNGIAVWDTAAAVRVFRMAKEKGIGRELPLWSEKREAAAGS